MTNRQGTLTFHHFYSTLMDLSILEMKVRNMFILLFTTPLAYESHSKPSRNHHLPYHNKCGRSLLKSNRTRSLIISHLSFCSLSCEVVGYCCNSFLIRCCTIFVLWFCICLRPPSLSGCPFWFLKSPLIYLTYIRCILDSKISIFVRLFK